MIRRKNAFTCMPVLDSPLLLEKERDRVRTVRRSERQTQRERKRERMSERDKECGRE